MTRERLAEIENALLTCGDSVVLPVAEAAELVRIAKGRDLYTRRLLRLEAERDDSTPRNDDALLNLEAL